MRDAPNVYLHELGHEGLSQQGFRLRVDTWRLGAIAEEKCFLALEIKLLVKASGFHVNLLFDYEFDEAETS